MSIAYAAMRDSLLVVDEPREDPTATERLSDRDLECVAAHPDRPERAFVGTFAEGLWRTTDGGESFERVGEGTIDPGEDSETAERRGVGDGVSVMSVTVSPHDPDVVLAGTEPSSLFRSTDGGDSWERIEGITDQPSTGEWYFPPRPYTHHVRWIEVDPNDAERLYVGIEAGALLVSDDGGKTWTERPPGSRRDNHTLATHPDAEGRVYSAAGDGYAESRDGGESWTEEMDGLDHGYVWGLAVDPGDPETVLVSAAHGAGDAHGHGGAESAESYVYRKDGSAEWEQVSKGLPTGEGVLRAVLADGSQRGEVFAANNHGVFRTGDGGESWTRVDLAWPDRFESETARGLAVV